MLILSRKIDEAIHIGDTIKVTILSTEKGVVKLGIDAPDSFTILRDELYEQISTSNKEASKPIADDVLKNFFKDLIPKGKK